MTNASNIIKNTLSKQGIVPQAAVQSDDSDPIGWIKREFYIPELNGPMPLEAYQEAVLREAYRRDESGRYVYSLIVWSDIKKSAKSSIAAAVCIERAYHTRYGSVKIIANDLKQADSRVAYYARRAIDLNPRLSEKVHQKIHHLYFPNKAIIEAVPIDPSGEAGGNDDLLCFSELWGATGKAATRMWTEMTLSPTKFGFSQRWVETYAGFSGESEQLEQLYESGVRQGKLLDLGIPGLEVYVNEAARQLTLWNTVPRCPWQTPEYYAQETAILTPEEFNRVHRNQWSSTLSPFVPIEWWDACKGQIPAMDKYREIVVGIDAAVSDDCFAVVGTSHNSRPIIHPETKKQIDEISYVALRYLKIWYPPKGGKMQYSDPLDKFNRDYPEGDLRWLADNYNVIEFTYDPYQLHHLCTSLRNDNIGAFAEFSQGAQRLEADKQLYDLIRDRRIAHTGEVELREHIQNANRKTEGESKLRIVKRSEKLKIDSAVALSMASFRTLKLLTP